MRIKRKNGLKVLSIAIVLLLCLALAIGITGAFYQAKRQATGTLSMDQGIIIDYKGFNGSETGATWARGVTFELFSTKAGEVQPGAHIKVNAAGIRANEKSVNFYARVKLSYKFYNGETEVTLEDPTVLIKTSNLFGSNWEFSSMAAPKDYYYYVENGTTTFKTMVSGADFVELIQSNAEFIIEGEGFKGSNDLEGGGFVVGETSINKIEVYLTLETLQGDATAEQAKALGWKISSEVNFAKVDEGKIVKSNTTEVVTDEQLNVTINGNESKLEEVKFPYGEETVLEFDSKNVEYVELKYSDNTTEKFYELEASENSATKNSQIKVLADESHGTVKGYTVGLFGANEYKGFKFTTKGYNDDGTSYDIPNGIAVSGHLGYDAEITIPSSAKVRERDFKTVVKETNANDFYSNWLPTTLMSASYPCTLTWNNGSESVVIGNFSSLSEADVFLKDESEDSWLIQHEFDDFSKYEFTFSYTALCETTNIFYSDKSVVEVVAGAFANSTCSKISLPNTIVKIGIFAFQYSAITSIVIPESVKSIGIQAFHGCSDLTTITVKAVTPPTLGSFAISNEVQTIYVPSESVEAYKNADGWKDFADRIQAIA